MGHRSTPEYGRVVARGAEMKQEVRIQVHTVRKSGDAGKRKLMLSFLYDDEIAAIDEALSATMQDLGSSPEACPPK